MSVIKAALLFNHWFQSAFFSYLALEPDIELNIICKTLQSSSQKIQMESSTDDDTVFIAVDPSPISPALLLPSTTIPPNSSSSYAQPSAFHRKARYAKYTLVILGTVWSSRRCRLIYNPLTACSILFVLLIYIQLYSLRNSRRMCKYIFKFVFLIIQQNVLVFRSNSRMGDE